MRKQNVFIVTIALLVVSLAIYAENLKTGAVSPKWEKVKAVTVQLLPQNITLPNGGSMKTVSVQGASQNGKVFFRVSWKDATKNQTHTGDKFADGAGLMFPTTKSAVTSPFMGDANNPVMIWQWRADWQNPDAMKKEIAEAYPSYADWYPPHEKSFFEGLGRHPEKGKAAIYLAKGFGTLTLQPLASVDVKGGYDETKKMYSVVFSRRLTAQDEIVQFKAGSIVDFNIAVWDGGQKERGARKSVSLSWQQITLAKQK